jgi:glycosyltransferase involved in cell wall biosynthesis
MGEASKKHPRIVSPSLDDKANSPSLQLILKKVGIVHYTAPPSEVGGVEIVIAHHTRFLVKQGYEVHLIYGSGGGLKEKGVVEHKIPLLSPRAREVRMVQSQILSEGKETPSFIELKESIKEDLKKAVSGLDVCIVHNIPSMPFNFAATAAVNEVVEELGLKSIYWIHDSALLRKEWADKMDRFPLTLLHHKGMDIIYVTVTNFRAEQLAKLPPRYRLQGIHVIPNGVDVEDYLKFDETTRQLMHKLGISFQDFVILIPVRVTPRKNIELALAVADELRHLMGGERPIKVLITGPPDHHAITMGMSYLDYLNMEISKRGLEDIVIFCDDLISHERLTEGDKVLKWSVGDVYTIADLIFIPSKEEGFGLPVIEAGAARKLVFCSRIPPFQELIRDGIDGYMFDLSEDPKSIAFRIYKQYLFDVVESNFNNVMRRFSWDVILSKRLLRLL